MMKNSFFLLFVLNLSAQQLPISESNYFTYNKFNYGADINNISIEIHEDEKGQIICSEYSGNIYRIDNTFTQNAFPEIKEKNPQLIKHFKMPDGQEYYCTNQEIIIALNRKIQHRIKLNPQTVFSHNFQKLGSTIYFVTYEPNSLLQIRQFDGKKLTTLAKINPDKNRCYNQLFVTDRITVVDYIGNTVVLYSLENTKLKKIKTYSLPYKDFVLILYKDINNFSGFAKSDIVQCKKGVLSFDKSNTQIFRSGYLNKFYNTENGLEKNFFQLSDSGVEKLFSTTFSSRVFIPKYNLESNSYYCGTTTNLLRFFPHIKKFPRLFNNSNSSSVFTIGQDSKNRIWAGSYQGALSVIENNKVTQSKITDIMFMNGSLPYEDKMILFGETGKGALLFSDAENYKSIAKNATFFYGYRSKNNQIYLGSSVNGLWFTNAENLEKNEPEWNIVGEKQGLKLVNILTICEDKFGNIWTGRSNQGIAVYNPETQKAKTWLVENKEINFGSMATIKDTNNTLWFGSNHGGLLFYDGKSKTDYDVENFTSIKHPLLDNGKSITFIHQWKHFLLLGASDKILLFDLQKWYKTKTVSVRYLNSIEINLTNNTEQNTILTDKRDGSVWFSSSDMVYQWDIKKWLTLPQFKVTPIVIIKKEGVENEFTSNKQIRFKPTENSFDVKVQYQTKDNMPRFINGVLIKKGKKPVFENPDLQTKFHFANLSSGEYIFYVRVCQQDGSFDIFEYPIKINNFLWQNWWFWLLISLFPIGFLGFYFQKKNQIEKQKKKLSQLNLSSLSNQFRPHFMLNALNSIASQMEGKPHAEKVISRLGESINILYGFTQKNSFTISFKNEWKLVENSIEIQKLLFIPELKVDIKNVNLIPDDYKIPVGLFQIPVENALLHGLRNKTDGNCVLKISFEETKNSYFVSITDNGVGRENARKMNNFKKNGKGLETVFEMIKIINQHQKEAVEFQVIDLENNNGTQVKIILNKTINYDKIQL